MNRADPDVAGKWPPREVAAVVLLAVGGFGYLLFHALPFYSHQSYGWGVAGESREVFYGWSIWGIIWDVVTEFPSLLDSPGIELWLALLTLTGFPLGMILSTVAPFMLRAWSGSSVARWSGVVLSAIVIVFGPVAGCLLTSHQGASFRWEISYYVWWFASLATFTGLLFVPAKKVSMGS